MVTEAVRNQIPDYCNITTQLFLTEIQYDNPISTDNLWNIIAEIFMLRSNIGINRRPTKQATVDMYTKLHTERSRNY